MKILRLILTAFCFSLALSGCFFKQDRTTVVYGTITDEKGQPVDSIFILFKGLNFLDKTTLASTLSDSTGRFEAVLEVPKRVASIDVVIPADRARNPKFQKYYTGIIGKRDGILYSSCCNATIGEKTKYDFELISK